jgi:hypothetical protein
MILIEGRLMYFLLGKSAAAAKLTRAIVTHMSLSMAGNATNSPQNMPWESQSHPATCFFAGLRAPPALCLSFRAFPR